MFSTQNQSTSSSSQHQLSGGRCTTFSSAQVATIEDIADDDSLSPPPPPHRHTSPTSSPRSARESKSPSSTQSSSALQRQAAFVIDSSEDATKRTSVLLRSGEKNALYFLNDTFLLWYEDYKLENAFLRHRVRFDFLKFFVCMLIVGCITGTYSMRVEEHHFVAVAFTRMALVAFSAAVVEIVLSALTRQVEGRPCWCGKRGGTQSGDDINDIHVLLMDGSASQQLRAPVSPSLTAPPPVGDSLFAKGQYFEHMLYNSTSQSTSTSSEQRTKLETLTRARELLIVVVFMYISIETGVVAARLGSREGKCFWMSTYDDRRIDEKCPFRLPPAFLTMAIFTPIVVGRPRFVFITLTIFSALIADSVVTIKADGAELLVVISRLVLNTLFCIFAYILKFYDEKGHRMLFENQVVLTARTEMLRSQEISLQNFMSSVVPHHLLDKMHLIGVAGKGGGSHGGHLSNSSSPTFSLSTVCADVAHGAVAMAVDIVCPAELSSRMLPHEAAIQLGLFSARCAGLPMPPFTPPRSTRYVRYIRSVGDTSICVGGLFSDRKPKHSAFVEFATYLRATAPHFSVRVGIADGLLIGMPIGRDFIRYDVFGPALQDAQELVASCTPGRLHVAHSFSEKLPPSLLHSSQLAIEVAPLSPSPSSPTCGEGKGAPAPSTLPPTIATSSDHHLISQSIISTPTAAAASNPLLRPSRQLQPNPPSMSTQDLSSEDTGTTTTATSNSSSSMFGVLSTRIAPQQPPHFDGTAEETDPLSEHNSNSRSFVKNNSAQGGGSEAGLSSTADSVPMQDGDGNNNNVGAAHDNRQRIELPTEYDMQKALNAVRLRDRRTSSLMLLHQTAENIIAGSSSAKHHHQSGTESRVGDGEVEQGRRDGTAVIIAHATIPTANASPPPPTPAPAPAPAAPIQQDSTTSQNGSPFSNTSPRTQHGGEDMSFTSHSIHTQDGGIGSHHSGSIVLGSQSAASVFVGVKEHSYKQVTLLNTTSKDVGGGGSYSGISAVGFADVENNATFSATSANSGAYTSLVSTSKQPPSVALENTCVEEEGDLLTLNLQRCEKGCGNSCCSKFADPSTEAVLHMQQRRLDKRAFALCNAYFCVQTLVFIVVMIVDSRNRADAVEDLMDRREDDQQSVREAQVDVAKQATFEYDFHMYVSVIQLTVATLLFGFVAVKLLLRNNKKIRRNKDGEQKSSVAAPSDDSSSTNKRIEPLHTWLAVIASFLLVIGASVSRPSLVGEDVSNLSIVVGTLYIFCGASLKHSIIIQVAWVVLYYALNLMFRPLFTPGNVLYVVALLFCIGFALLVSHHAHLTQLFEDTVKSQLAMRQVQEQASIREALMHGSIPTQIQHRISESSLSRLALDLWAVETCVVLCISFFEHAATRENKREFELLIDEAPNALKGFIEQRTRLIEHAVKTSPNGTIEVLDVFCGTALLAGPLEEASGSGSLGRSQRHIQALEDAMHIAKVLLEAPPVLRSTTSPTASKGNNTSNHSLIEPFGFTVGIAAEQSINIIRQTEFPTHDVYGPAVNVARALMMEAPSPMIVATESVTRLFEQESARIAKRNGGGQTKAGEGEREEMAGGSTYYQTLRSSLRWSAAAEGWRIRGLGNVRVKKIELETEKSPPPPQELPSADFLFFDAGGDDVGKTIATNQQPHRHL